MSISSRRMVRTVKLPGLSSREMFDYVAGYWSEGSVQGGGRYNVLWTGGGIVQITSSRTLQLESAIDPVSGGWGDTASSLVVSTDWRGDFDETVRMLTLAQLRNEAVPAGSRGVPNAWEVA